MTHQDLDNDLTLVVRTHQLGNWYYINNIVQDHYAPIIGLEGMAIYNLYSRVSRREDEQVRLPRKIILPHLGIGASTLTKYNFVLEWSELIYIRREHLRIHDIYLLDPKPITPERLMILRRRYGRYQDKYPALVTKLLKNLSGWRSLQDRRDEVNLPTELAPPKVIKMVDETGEPTPATPEKPTNFRIASAAEQVQDQVAHDELVVEMTAALGNGSKANRTARYLVDTYGAEACARQLAWWSRRCEIAEASQRGLDNPGGLLRRSIEENWGEPSQKAREKTFIDELIDMGLA